MRRLQARARLASTRRTGTYGANMSTAATSPPAPATLACDSAADMMHTTAGIPPATSGRRAHSPWREARVTRLCGRTVQPHTARQRQRQRHATGQPAHEAHTKITDAHCDAGRGATRRAVGRRARQAAGVAESLTHVPLREAVAAERAGLRHAHDHAAVRSAHPQLAVPPREHLEEHRVREALALVVHAAAGLAPQGTR